VVAHESVTRDTRTDRPERDDGLRRLMTWTFAALAATVLFTAAVVLLMMYWLERAP
jgi:hypothetical protein